MAARAIGRRRFMQAALGVGALGFVPALAGCERKGGAPRVVVYVSVDDVLAREVLAACTAATRVLKLPAPTATSTMSLACAAKAEAARAAAMISFFMG